MPPLTLESAADFCVRLDDLSLAIRQAFLDNDTDRLRSMATEFKSAGELLLLYSDEIDYRDRRRR